MQGTPQGYGVPFTFCHSPASGRRTRPPPCGRSPRKHGRRFRVVSLDARDGGMLAVRVVDDRDAVDDGGGVALHEAVALKLLALQTLPLVQAIAERPVHGDGAAVYARLRRAQHLVVGVLVDDVEDGALGIGRVVVLPRQPQCLSLSEPALEEQERADGAGAQPLVQKALEQPRGFLRRERLPGLDVRFRELDAGAGVAVYELVVHCLLYHLLELDVDAAYLALREPAGLASLSIGVADVVALALVGERGAHGALPERVEVVCVLGDRALFASPYNARVQFLLILLKSLSKHGLLRSLVHALAMERSLWRVSIFTCFRILAHVEAVLENAVLDLIDTSVANCPLLSGAHVAPSA